MEWIKTSQNSKKVSVPYRGYSFFNSVKSLFLSLTMTKVSVPYRGYSFFNVDIIYLKFDNVLLVSVPYRGYSFFNLQDLEKAMWYLSQFPSLTGVIRFLIHKANK